MIIVLSRNMVTRILVFMLIALLTLPVACAEVVGGPTQQADTNPVHTEGTQFVAGPVLMATEYAIVEGETVPGSSFVLEMKLANLSEYNSAYNVMATLTIENLSVSLQQGVTNQMYFHEIKPTQTVVLRFPLEVYSYCTEENMVLTLTIACYDAGGVHYTYQTMMTPDIEVARTLQVGSLSVPQFVHRNSSMIITATLNNIEPVALSNVKMHVKTQYGDQVTDVGQLLPNESMTVNSIYRFPEQQTEHVQVYFTYESLYGHQYATDLRPFEVVVYDPAEENDFAASSTMSLAQIADCLMQDITIPGTEASVQLPVIVLILVGCVGYVIVLYFALRNKKR